MSHSTAEFVFLHGLTFDHHMWDPAVAGLPAGARSLAPDLPGHGHAPALDRHHVEDVVEAVHADVLAAGMDAPILVGHSAGGLLATVYAARHPVAAVVNVDQPLAPPAPFLHGVRQLEAQLRGPGFPQVWAMFQASMHLELVPPAGRDLLRAGESGVAGRRPELLGRGVHARRRGGGRAPGRRARGRARVRRPLRRHVRRPDRARGAGVGGGAAAGGRDRRLAGRPPLPPPRPPRALRRAAGRVAAAVSPRQPALRW